ncbi:Uncharacterised protein [Vibrio cholerae]|nr:Uncharacterised protein [Vibrio cholerae]
MVKKGSKILAKCSGEIPWPLSAICTCTQALPFSFKVSVVMVNSPCSSQAWEALMNMFISTCCISGAIPLILGRFSASCRSTSMVYLN